MKYQGFIEEFLEWIETIFTLPICTVILEENILNRIRYNRSPPKANFDYRDDRVHTFFTDGSASIADLELDREAAWAIVEDLCQ